MAESTAFPKPRETSDTGYRRVSGFAIAGLVIGILFVAFLFLQVIVGLLSHSTVLMPLWLEFFAALGMGLSLAGTRAIRHSDGTLAGLRIARWGLWICLIAGLGYGSYYGATYLAVRQQAEAYTADWFDKIRKGDLNKAFLMTQQGGGGRGVNPDDEKAMEIRFNAPIPGPKGAPSKGGMLDLFRYNEIILMLRQGGDAAKVIPLGVRTWEHKEGAYLVRRVYRIETPTASFDMLVATVRKEGPEAAEKGGGWYVAFMETSVEKDSLVKSPLGLRIDQLRANGKEFMDQWGHAVYSGQLEVAFLDTLDPKDVSHLLNRERLRTYGCCLAAFMEAARGNIVNGMAACVPTERTSVRKLSLPGYDAAFNKAGLLDFRQMKGDDNAARESVEVALRNMLAPAPAGAKAPIAVMATLIAQPVSARRIWSVDAEKRLLLPLECQILVGPPGATAKYYASSVAWLQSEPGALDNEKNTRWRLTKLEVLRVGDVAELHSGASGGRQSATVRFQ